MPKNFSDAPIPEITRIYSFSQPSLTRFAKKLGFDGFLRFQYQLKNDLSNNTATDNSSRAEFYGSFMKLIEKSIKEADLNDLANHLMNANRIVFLGNSLSNILAYFMDQMSKITNQGTSMCTEAISTIWSLSKNDMIFVFSSYTGNNIKGYVNHEKDGPYCVLVTLTNKHPLKKHFDKVIVLPEAKSVHRHRNIMTETFAYLMFCDLLTNKIEELTQEK